MHGGYETREEWEDVLYDDASSEDSLSLSELEFRLYSQLHYSSNAADLEELVDKEKNDGPSLENQQHDILETAGEGGSQMLLQKDSMHSSSNNESLQQHKKKKRKTNNIPATHQKSPLPVDFEEVIVIDSGPDVISISDDETSDEGICTRKGQGSRKIQTSTPSQQETQNRRSPIVPEIVASSSSTSSESKAKSESDSNPESESESESSGSSDSDELENWMILGQGMLDGDDSISLNLKGVSYNATDACKEEEESWFVSEKDKEAQIYNKGSGPRIQRVSNRYFTEKNVHCRNCNKTGHLSKNCSESKTLFVCYLCGMEGHVARACLNKHCTKCELPGHSFESCREKAYWYKHCYRCSMKGHCSDECPETWRQYHSTITSGPPVCGNRLEVNRARSTASCYNCSKKEHFGFECVHKRMFSGVFPSSSFISHYDTVEYIERRRHGAKMKANEMRKRGHLPASSLREQQKEKQKTNLHQNNQPKPTPRHIIFNDTDFSNSTRKTTGFKQQQVAKPWKTKRPVPTSRGPLPSSELAFDGEEDFPRGWAKQPDKKQNKKKKKMNKTRQSLFQSDGHQDSKSNHLFNMQKLASKNRKGEKKKNWKNYTNKVDSQLYYEEDNLFGIKQRRHKR